jgi:hypothetical protein
LEQPSEEFLQIGAFAMERTRIEPVTSGLQTLSLTRLHLTPINRIGMAEPKSAFSSDVI